jgi:hypothetical protein
MEPRGKPSHWATAHGSRLRTSGLATAARHLAFQHPATARAVLRWHSTMESAVRRLPHFPRHFCPGGVLVLAPRTLHAGPLVGEVPKASPGGPERSRSMLQKVEASEHPHHRPHLPGTPASRDSSRTRARNACLPSPASRRAVYGVEGGGVSPPLPGETSLKTCDFPEGFPQLTSRPAPRVVSEHGPPLAPRLEVSYGARAPAAAGQRRRSGRAPQCRRVRLEFLRSLLMIMLEHKVPRRSQIDTYAGPPGLARARHLQPVVGVDRRPPARGAG